MEWKYKKDNIYIHILVNMSIKTIGEIKAVIKTSKVKPLNDYIDTDSMIICNSDDLDDFIRFLVFTGYKEIKEEWKHIIYKRQL